MATVILAYSSLPGQLPAALRRRLASDLPHARRSRLGSHGPAQSQTLLAIALACQLLARICGHPVSASQLRFPYGGKPRGRGLPDFSITHAGSWVGCAVATAGRVGLDLEVLDGAILPAFGFCFDPQELQQATDARAALGIWCAKEATLKAAGATLAEMRAVSVRGDAAQFRRQRWWVHAPPAPPELACRLVTDRPPLALRCERVAWRALCAPQACRGRLHPGKYRALLREAVGGQSA
ncbi:MAG TPA: 4'-phosphopantetheinyl transferase superfamily protein [Steroidobacteraceae bacterium]|nr:4'-phosphopantetheinyl transferase superfamily protein [Steroidobacteraceae bacterium]